MCRVSLPAATAHARAPGYSSLCIRAGCECPIHIGHFASVSFSTNSLIFNGGQGQNRTADTRIFSPQESAPSRTQQHPKQPAARKWPLGRFSWVLLDDPGLGTKVETRVSRPSSPGNTECL